MNKRRALMIAAAGLAGGAGVALYRFLGTPSTADLSRLVFPDLDGKPQPLAQWLGGTLLMNFWAPWCEPCREEIPALIRVREKLGQNLQILGISLDTVANVREFAVTWRIPYPLVLGGLPAMELMRATGNKAGVLPYSIVLDSRGQLTRTQLGVLSEEDWLRLLGNNQSTA
jgi:thiol-disulfide isomerase/thioredoxin